MSTIKWKPILEGEDLTASRLLEPATKIATKLNDVDADCFRENGLGVDAFSGNLGVVEHSQTINTGSLKPQLINGHEGCVWTGNPSSGEDAFEHTDILWHNYVLPTHTSSTATVSESAPLFMKRSTEGRGWDWLLTHTLDNTVNLRSDNSNSILVLTEVEVQQLFASDAKPADQQGEADFTETEKPTGIDPTPHILLFTMVVATINTTGGGLQDVPLPNTVRFIEAETNTFDSSNSDSDWITTGTPPEGRECTALTSVFKNIPTRALVTYDDLASSAFNANTGTNPGDPSGATLLPPRDSDSTSVKQVKGFKMFVALKYCSGKYFNGINTSVTAEIKNRTISALVLDSQHEKTDSSLTLTYP